MLEIAAAVIVGMVMGGAIASLIAVRSAQQQKRTTHNQMRRTLEQRERQHQIRLRSHIQSLQTHYDTYYSQVLYVMRQLLILWNSDRTDLHASQSDLASVHEQHQTHRASYANLQTQLHQAQQQHRAMQKAITRLENELTAARTDRDHFMQELEQSEHQRQQLEQQVQQFWQDLGLYYQTNHTDGNGTTESYSTQFESIKAIILAQASLTFSSVLEAVEFIEFLFPTCLEIWDSARESAASSRFPRPYDVYKNIYALTQVGQEYFEKDGNLGRNFYQAFQEYGVIFVDKESESTQTNKRLLQERLFRHQNRTKTMMRHLKVGTGRGENTLRIYFDFNLMTRRVEIGYCGAHLKTSSIR